MLRSQLTALASRPPLAKPAVLDASATTSSHRRAASVGGDAASRAAAMTSSSSSASAAGATASVQALRPGLAGPPSGSDSPPQPAAADPAERRALIRSAKDFETRTLNFLIYELLRDVGLKLAAVTFANEVRQGDKAQGRAGGRAGGREGGRAGGRAGMQSAARQGARMNRMRRPLPWPLSLPVRPLPCPLPLPLPLASHRMRIKTWRPGRMSGWTHRRHRRWWTCFDATCKAPAVALCVLALVSPPWDRSDRARRAFPCLL